MWSIGKEEFMERMTESAKATVDHFAGHITFVNVLRNMSVSCDCEASGPRRLSRPTSASWPRSTSSPRTRPAWTSSTP